MTKTVPIADSLGVLPVPVVAGTVRRALAEDAARDDVTTRWSVPPDTWARARIVARQAGVVAGVPVAAEVFHQVDPAVRVDAVVAEGARVAVDDTLVLLEGPARGIITGERVALNMLQRMSGIATLASRFRDAVAGSGVRVLDTRKTAPGLRLLDKYAVAAGGATNHRPDLSAMVLLKENHVAAAGGVTEAVAAVRRGLRADRKDLAIEVEVRTVAEAMEAFDAGVDWVMLDNMDLDTMRRVVALRDALPGGRRPKLEASGTITLATAAAVAGTGVDAMSVGALTHSAPALDLSLLLGEVTDGRAPLRRS